MKVLYMTEHGNLNPWYEDFSTALDDRFEVSMWSPDRSFADRAALSSRADRGGVRRAAQSWAVIVAGLRATRAANSARTGRMSGWEMPASASTPSTRRGPGRTNAASASTAHTGTPGGRVASSMSAVASSAVPARS